MPATTEQKVAFRTKTLPIFDVIEHEYGISPSIALMQAAEESNWGLSRLATDGKNIFSITPGQAWLSFKNGALPVEKVTPWSPTLGIATVHYNAIEYSKYPPEKIRHWEFRGDMVNKRPDGKGGSVLTVDRHFRQYGSWNESADDWAHKISTQSIYQAAFDAARLGDVIAYAHALAMAGYATDADYAINLIAYANAINALPEATV